jgi:hypothetical protein
VSTSNVAFNPVCNSAAPVFAVKGDVVRERD